MNVVLYRDKPVWVPLDMGGRKSFSKKVRESRLKILFHQNAKPLRCL